MLIRTLIGWCGKLLLSALIAVPVYWVNSVLQISPTWNIFLVLAVSLSTLPVSVWRWLPWLSPVGWRALLLAGAAVIPLLLTPTVAHLHDQSAALYVLTIAALLGISLIYEQPDALRKLTLSTLGLAFGLVAANFLAAVVLDDLNRADQPGPPPAASVNESGTPGTSSQVALVGYAATLIPTPTSTPAPEVPPPEQPVSGAPHPVVAGTGYMEFIEDGGEAEWGYLTGYGPRINARARAYMLDGEGKLVYDTMVAFNSKGARGPEVDYEKPDDVYRILIIGDSFVEALQVNYEQTFYALLQDELAKHNTPGRKFEVIALGRTGWGTLQEYLYYHVEGYKYHPDLVVVLFYINDVADNYPGFFYPGINNTNFEYVFEGDSVRIVDTNDDPLPPNAPRKLYNALPDLLRKTNLARLYVRLGDPPPPVLTPGGVMTRVHPQFYIYVTDPKPEGYDEAWQRTARAFELMAHETQQNGSELVVVPVFIGAEFIQSVSGWFPELVAGWQWDDSLPEKRLGDILDGLGATLIPTRPTYEAYAQRAGGQVYDLIFLPEDRHFNALGHQLTKDTIYNYLVEQGLVPANDG